MKQRLFSSIFTLTGYCFFATPKTSQYFHHKLLIDKFITSSYLPILKNFRSFEIFRYLMIDVWGIWSGSPFYYAGMNSILLYMGHEICHDYFPFSWKLFTHTHSELLAMNIWGTTLWVIAAYVLFKKRIFLAI